MRKKINFTAIHQEKLTGKISAKPERNAMKIMIVLHSMTHVERDMNSVIASKWRETYLQDVVRLSTENVCILNFRENKS